MKIILFIFAIVCGCYNADAYNILVITVIPSKSHHNLCSPIADALAKQGHSVTFISPFPRKKSPCNEIGVPRILEVKDKNPMMGFAMTNMSMVQMLTMMSEWQPTIARLLQETEEFTKQLDDKSSKFDLVILEYFNNDFLIGLGVKFDCPVIAISPINMIGTLAKMIGNPYSIATVPNPFFDFPIEMSLGDRIKNFLSALMIETMDIFFLHRIQKDLYENYYPNEAIKVPYNELKNKIVAVLMNTHPSISVSRPLLPNVIEIGGYHVNEPEPLPEDLKKIMDSAKHGVIYFSMGSVLKGSEMDSSMKEALLKSFSKLKYTILWKFEEDLTGKPKNVIIRNWMPQNSILAHPNLKLFITHGGFLSYTEATHFGVPLVAIPVFGDQSFNARMMSDRGQGVVLKLNNITERSVDWAINEILTHPRYAEAAVRIQKLYFDRPMKPRDLMVYSVEHVIRTRGASHLTPPKLSRWSLLLLDVYAAILIPIGIAIYLIRLCCRKFCCRNKKSKLTEDKKNN